MSKEVAVCLAKVDVRLCNQNAGACAGGRPAIYSVPGYLHQEDSISFDS
jgi:hypothetical protein